MQNAVINGLRMNFDMNAMTYGKGAAFKLEMFDIVEADFHGGILAANFNIFPDAHIINELNAHVEAELPPEDLPVAANNEPPENINLLVQAANQPYVPILN